MDGVNSAVITRLREIFTTMEVSRVRLRPILADIAASIDKGFFIDADSEEVNLLLKQILEAQEKFSTVEQTKRAASLGNMEQVEKALATLEQNSKREELTQVLAKISTIILDSTDEKMKQSLRQVQLQAEHLKNKASKTDTANVANFFKQAERFVLLDEIVSSNEVISPEKYLEALQSFPDNPILVMALSQNKLHYPGAVVEVEEVKPQEKVEVAADKKSSSVPNIHAVRAVSIKYRKIQPPPDLSLVLYDEKSFVIEKSTSRKNFTVKSFNNKLHELVEKSDPAPIFKMFMESRILFKDSAENIKFSAKITKNLAVLTPAILDRLFSWGLADKVTWRECQFYYLNDFGMELCTRVYRNFARNIPQSGESDFDSLVHSIKFALMKMSEARLKDVLKINFEYNPDIAFARAEYKLDSDVPQVILMLSLNLLGKNWEEEIAKFRLLIERDINDSVYIKAVIVFVFDIDDLSWMKMFDTVKFKNIRFLMGTKEGFVTPTGVAFTFDEWMSLWKFGHSNSKRGRKNLSDSKKEFLQGLFEDKKVLPEKVSSEKVSAEKSEKDDSADDESDVADDSFSEEVVPPSFSVTPEPTLPFDDDEDVNLYFVGKQDAKKDSEYVKEVAETYGSEDDADITPVEIVEPAANVDDNDDIQDVDEDVEPVEDIRQVDDIKQVKDIRGVKDIRQVDENFEPVEVADEDKVEPANEDKVESADEDKAADKSEDKKSAVIDSVATTQESDLAKVDGVTVVSNLFKSGAVSRAMLALHALKDFIAQTEPDVENWAAYLSDEVGFILDDPLTFQTVRN
ncbi:MAG: hypothetical protein IJU91_09525, partial [Selenomonadaceae bacterium]|nr:hypothetical protein [Selenomonadaceae bacterium]